MAANARWPGERGNHSPPSTQLGLEQLWANQRRGQQRHCWHVLGANPQWHGQRQGMCATMKGIANTSAPRWDGPVWHRRGARPTVHKLAATLPQRSVPEATSRGPGGAGGVRKPLVPRGAPSVCFKDHASTPDFGPRSIVFRVAGRIAMLAALGRPIMDEIIKLPEC